MKKFKLFTLLLMVLALAAGLCACGGNNVPPDGGTQTTYEIALNEDLPRTLHVGDEVDFTKYFTVTDQDGNPVTVTADMLDLSKADTSAPGTFTVTLTVGEVKKSAEFTVLPQETPPPAEEKLTELKLSPASLELIVGKTGKLEVERVPAAATEEEIAWTTDDEEVATVKNGTVTAVGVGTAHISVASKENPSVKATAEVTVTADPMKTLEDVLKTYDDPDAWNFAVTRTETYDIYSFDDYYEYLGRNVLNAYEDGYGDFYTDYLGYDEEADAYAYFCDNGDGTYERYAEGTDDYDYWCTNLYLVDIQALKSVEFTYADGVYSAQNAATAADAVLGEYLIEDEDTGDLYIYTYTSLTLTLADGRIAEISATLDDGTEITYVFSDYGEVDFTLPAYDPDEEDRETLSAALETVKDLTVEGTTELKTAVDDVQLAWTLNTDQLPDGITFSGHTITVTDRPATDTLLEFTVKATLNNVSGTKVITVTVLGDPNKLTGLGFIGDTINLTEGEEQVLNVVRTPSSSTEELNWTSDTPAVATVGNDGTVKAVGVGQAHITVECKRDPSIKATITVVVTADPKKLTSLTLEPAALDVIEGKTGTFTVHMQPMTAVSELKWTSSDDETATVENGKVTGLKQGTVTITVESVENPFIKATATVTVIADPEKLTALTISPASLTLKVNGTAKLTAARTPATADAEEIEWISDTLTVATVENDGTVKAVGEGTAQITVQSKTNPAVKATITVTVEAAEVIPPAPEKLTELRISPASLELIEGKTGKLEAERIPATATEEELVWTTDSEQVATVAGDGTVTAHGVGTAHISVASKENPAVKATIEVTVKADPNKLTKLEFSEETLELTEGDEVTLSVKRTPDTATEEELEWTSDMTSVVSVENGTVKAVGVGQATVTVQSKVNSAVKATIEITVKAKPVTPPEPQDEEIELTSLLETTELTTGYKTGTYTVGGISVTVSNVSVNNKLYVGSDASENTDFNFLQFKANGSSLEITGEFTKIVIVMLSKYAYQASSMLTVMAGSATLPIAKHTASEGFTLGSDTYSYFTEEYNITAGGAQKITITNANTFASYVKTITLISSAGGTQPSETEQQKVTRALSAVNSSYEVSVTGDYRLPVSTVDGVTFTWAVTSGNYSLTNGNALAIPQLPETDETVRLTLTATCGSASSDKTVTVTVKAKPVTPPEPQQKTLELKSMLATTDLTSGYKSGTYTVDGTAITVSNVSVNSKVYVSNVSTEVGFDFLQFKAGGSTLSLTGEFTKIVTVMLSKYAYDPSSMFTITAGSTTLSIANHSTGDGFKVGADTYYLHTVEYNVTTSGAQQITFKDANTFALYAQTITLTGTTGGSTTPVDPTPGGDDTADKALQDALKGYENHAAWNFAITRTETYEGESFDDYYEYLGYNILNSYEDENGDTYTDYLGYDTASGSYSFYYDNGDGTYDILAENTDDYDESYSYLYLVDLAELKNIKFTYSGGKYSAQNGATAAMAVLGEYSYTDYYGDVITAAWTSFDVYLANGRISKIVANVEDGTVVTYTFSKYGSVSFTLPSGGSGTDTPVTPSGTMEKQTYDASTFDKENLQDKLLKENSFIGLPSTGSYHVLVVPVQFKGENISDAQLQNLEKAVNGSATDTGWESVKTYYQKASYGKLNLTFDVQGRFETAYNASHYETLNAQGQYGIEGSEAVLLEALSHYASTLDLSIYDYNGDQCIDAVYLIYSHAVDYSEDTDFYWAYTTYTDSETKFDGLYAGYYFFAGFDFMDENTARDTSSAEKISGLKINASTYIHESGHLLGLDDYYDYEERKGSNEGLGSADMMDYTVGDQNVYSKTMLGWLSPTVVNGTTTVTLKPSASEASAILIPLSFNNSYFCEYLMIDLYAATGLNQMHAGMDNSYLYDGAPFGVRIYHVSSSINNSYSTDYQSFTDYNNSDTNFSLIKLVEADGTKKFSDSNGWAAADDLWKAGQKLSTVFPNYTRNDGKTLNFDVEIVSASAESAQVKITFNS